MVSLQAAVLALALGGGGGDTVLLDFSAKWCGPCRQMEPIVAQLIAQGYPVRKVDIDHDRALAAQYQVTGVPCFVMLVDGEEVDRIIGGTTQRQLEQLLRSSMARRSQSTITAAQTAAAPPEPAAIAPAPAPAPAAPARTTASTAPTSVRIPSVLSGPPLVAVTRPPRSAAIEQSATPPSDAAAASPIDALSTDNLTHRLLAASVRLKIDDHSGRSVGSGTIIDARSGEALILTCGHVFRDSQGKGKILVDLFGPGAPQGVPARLISYDLKTDLGLLSIRPGTKVTVAPLAAADYQLRAQQPVTNIGCTHGADPTARSSQITSINKFLGAPNVQVAGQPIEGRSGGGLFNAAGQVIGVCNAADPADNEGLYAALPAIYGQLEQLGLRQILAHSETDVALAQNDSPAVLGMPEHMPAVQLGAPAAQAPAAPQAPAALLNAQEATLLGELKSKTAGAEVICIVRSLSDPRAKSEIIVLDRASPDFLESLAADRERQAGRRLTSMSVKREQPAEQPQHANQPQAWQPEWKLPSGASPEANSPARLNAE